jgi:hypothetical protein
VQSERAENEGFADLLEFVHGRFCTRRARSESAAYRALTPFGVSEPFPRVPPLRRVW